MLRCSYLRAAAAACAEAAVAVREASARKRSARERGEAIRARVVLLLLLLLLLLPLALLLGGRAYLAGLASLHVRSTTDTSGVGTRKAMPVSLPFSSGSTLPTALAAPVDAGMMFCAAPRPPRQSLPDGPSTVFCVAVVACTVVIRPCARRRARVSARAWWAGGSGARRGMARASTMPYSSLMILARGARQLVVHEAFESTLTPFVYFVWLTPITNIGASADGAEMITFLAPPCRCADAFSTVVKMPVDSHTTSAPHLPQGTSFGLRIAKNLIGLPSTYSVLVASSAVTSPLYCPCVESYLKR
jgi:hypothetical protein